MGGMEPLSLALGLVLGASGVIVWYFGTDHGPNASTEAPGEPYLRDRLDELTQRVHALEDTPEYDLGPIVSLLEELAAQMDTFERDLEEGLDVARRRENRIRTAVSRAMARLEEDGEADPNLLAVAEELRDRDGGRGEEEGVQPVQEGLGVAFDQPSAVPGLTERQLREMGLG